MKIINYRWQVALGAFGFMAISQPVKASGFQIRLHSAPLIGTAYAGNAAIGNEITAMIDNPANLAYCMASQIAVGATPIWPTIKFRSDAGVAVRDSAASAVVPSGFASWNFNSKWKFGLALTTPFGLKTDYSATSVVAPFNMLTDLLTQKATAVAAYKVNDILSLGVGLEAMYSNAELTKLALPSPLNITSRIKGKGWGVGGTVGFIVQPTCATRIGLAYNFSILTKVRGNVRFTPQRPASNLINASTEASVKYPDSATLSVHHQINEQWALMASAIYTGWSKFKELRLKFSSGLPDDVTSFNFRNTWFWSIGVTYKPTADWILRAGIALDEGAIKSDDNRHFSVPDSRRKWLACGATYKFSKNWDLTASYAHEFVSHTRISGTKTYPAPLPAKTLSGNFRQHIDFVALQVRYTF